MKWVNLLKTKLYIRYFLLLLKHTTTKNIQLWLVNRKQSTNKMNDLPNLKEEWILNNKRRKNILRDKKISS